MRLPMSKLQMIDKTFSMHAILAFVLFEGKFKGVITEDEELKKKIFYETYFSNRVDVR